MSSVSKYTKVHLRTFMRACACALFHACLHSCYYVHVRLRACFRACILVRVLAFMLACAGTCVHACSCLFARVLVPAWVHAYLRIFSLHACMVVVRSIIAFLLIVMSSSGRLPTNKSCNVSF